MVLGEHRIQWQRVYVELTNACNCKCEFCPRSTMTRPVQHMNLGLVYRLLSEIHGLAIAPKVTLHVMGEPTLHPHFFQILDFTQRLGLDVSLVTNGTRLGGIFGQRLSQYPLHETTLSIQTPDATSFSHRHAPLNFEDYYRGIITFLQRMYTTQTQTRFSLRFLSTFLFEKTHTDMIPYSATCSQYSHLQAVLSVWCCDILSALGMTPEDVERILARLAQLRLHRWGHIELNNRLKFDIWPMLEWLDWSNRVHAQEVKTGACMHYRDHVAVLSNGDVTLCCMDFNGHTVLGNIGDCLLADIVQGEKARYIWSEFTQQRVALPFCRRCLGSWHQMLQSLRKGKTIRSTQRAMKVKQQSACQLWS